MGGEAERAIETSGLTKMFAGVAVVDQIDLTVTAGSIYGLLGPNGGGKTTLVRMLATLVRPDAGQARVFGHHIVKDAGAVRARIAMTGQFSSVDDELTGRENLILIGRLLGHSWTQSRRRADELLNAFELDEAAKRQVATYSGGMRRRLDIASTIFTTPDLLFLDEPTTGLDPQSRNEVWQVVRLLAAGGTTVLLTTQYLDEADQLADRIGVMNNGRMVAEGTSAQLKSSIGSGSLRVRVDDPNRTGEAADILSTSLGASVHVSADDSAIAAQVSSADDALRALGAVVGAGIAASDFALGQPSLDEVFLALTGSNTNTASTAEGLS